MTAVRTPVMELSCYTTSLVAYLETERPDAARRLAESIRLAVRPDPSGPGIAFSHHGRIDLSARPGCLTGAAEGLVYRGSPEWERTRTALREEAERFGRVLAVANTRTVPWSPAYGRSTAAHWIVVRPVPGGLGTWHIEDRFAALLPDGEQKPHRTVVDDDGLRSLLTPLGALPRPFVLRDSHALGTPTPLPAPGDHRWLVRAPLPPQEALDGPWLTDTGEALEFLADRLISDPALLAAHADDLWAASRHQRHRLELLAATGRVPADAAADAAARWGELPRSLRFALESAGRGRPRTGLLTRAFADLTDAMNLIRKEERP
ncbi:hypothetical protein ACFVIM_12740 [Streptomyces sp. NPDC057638]|uniref:hypothetical protein n=1 Tax=Streptomyces sp. NPDC057638 TaxID=3346190 RepID=UPI0036B617B6